MYSKLSKKIIVVFIIFFFVFIAMRNNFIVHEYSIKLKTTHGVGRLINLCYQDTYTQYVHSLTGTVNLNNELSFNFKSSKTIKILDIFDYQNNLELDIMYYGQSEHSLKFNSHNIKNVILEGRQKIDFINIFIYLVISIILSALFILCSKISVYLRNTIAFLSVFTLLFIILLQNFIDTYFSTYSLQEILFFVVTPFTGTDMEDVNIFIRKCLAPSICLALIIIFLPEILYFMYYKIIRYIRKYFKRYAAITACYIMCLYLGYCFYTNGLWYILFPGNGNFYKEHYTNATKEIIKVPLKKRNLILLQIESLDKSFANAEFYGNSLITDLQNYEKNGIVFTNYNEGFGTTPTQPSLIAVFTGLPSTKLTAQVINNKGQYKVPFAKVYSLGDILSDAGYESFSIRGSDGIFSGTHKFLENHGVTHNIDKHILDRFFFTTSHSKNKWGYYDEDIYKVTQNILKKQRQPFFAFIQTIDTHCGIFRGDVENKFNNKYYNTIHNTSKKTVDFLQWIKEQDFAENTTVIVYGDHLRKENEIPYPAQRSIYNLFINPVKTPQNLNRYFTQVDLFPSILEAIGFEIEGHRLGIGTSIFSDETTLAEKYDEEYLEEQLSKDDDTYNSLL